MSDNNITPSDALIPDIQTYIEENAIDMSALPNIHGSRVVLFDSKAKETKQIEQRRQQERGADGALDEAEITNLADPKVYQDIDDPYSLLKRFNARFFVIKKYFGKCVVGEFI